MRYLFVFLMLVSCRAAFHVKRAKHHIEKAVEKDPSIEVVPERTIVNTITEVDTLRIGDTVFVTRTDSIFVQSECPEYDFSKVETNSQTRQKERTKRAQIKQENKTLRELAEETTKQIKNTNRHETKQNRRWTMFLMGVLSGLVLMIVLRLAWKNSIFQK